MAMRKDACKLIGWQKDAISRRISEFPYLKFVEETLPVDYQVAFTHISDHGLES
jgi:hypothetical protein